MRMRAVPVGDAPVPQKVTGASRRPLLSGPLSDQARHLAGALNQTHRPPSTPAPNDASLASGAAGLAVCSGQLARTRSDRQAADTALTYLEEAIGMLATEPLTSSLYSVFIGIAWAVELVDQLLGVEGEYRDAEIDDVLATLLQRYPDNAPYDLINGLARRGGSRCGARHRRRHPLPSPGTPARAGPGDRPSAARRRGQLASGPHGRHSVRADRPVLRDQGCRAGASPLRLVLRRPRRGRGVAASGPRRRRAGLGGSGNRYRGTGRRPAARPDRRHGRRALPRLGRPRAPVQPDVRDDRGTRARRGGAILDRADSRAVLYH